MGTVLSLVRHAFDSMDGRIDPPSSMHRLTPGAIAEQARAGEVWVIEDLGSPIACIFLTLQGDRLYLGKLAVDDRFRGQGLARELVDHAASRARALGLSMLELQVRVELTENQHAFQSMGFQKTAETAHDGYDRPTSLTFARRV
ncbi:GNAT family N-acetyltransferase [Defluviimonas sp. WL0002]|uniref:GNAT family N-acetyltransferase n=2 Tax=Albidovulum marisflavi TaxID=2984159 RepID=A0ABT2Z9W9_9RHOB|nr:GNAT family N-acetyltransferase [Defluviimonas sp. WL0002]MCV2867891.1 GNAT family N-acetyltransferase [Defluviimonas sp. WL0002]